MADPRRRAPRLREDAARPAGGRSRRRTRSTSACRSASGYLRVRLGDATAAASTRFAAALSDVVDPQGFPRYLVSRLVPLPGPVHGLAGAAALRPPFDRSWVVVPADLGRRKERAEAFARAWRRWLGPSELRFTQRSAEGKAALAAAGAQSPEYEAVRRRVWL